jgi:hypothetical protein
MDTALIVAAISATVSVLGIALNRWIDHRENESLRQDAERGRLQVERESAYVAWLAAVPQLAHGYHNLRRAQARLLRGVEAVDDPQLLRSRRETTGAELAVFLDEKAVLEAESRVRTVDSEVVSLAQAQLRLRASQVIADQARDATDVLRRTHGLTPFGGTMDLGQYERAFAACRDTMRREVGSRSDDELAAEKADRGPLRVGGAADEEPDPRGPLEVTIALVLDRREAREPGTPTTDRDAN